MKNLISIVVLVAIMVIIILLLPTPKDSVTDNSETSASVVAFKNIRLFDGTEVIENTGVLIRNGLVVDTGVDLDIPDQAEVVDGQGQTIIPGLIDSHVHVYGSARVHALRFGVTTVLDMFSTPDLLSSTRMERESLTETNQADLFSAGFLATVDGGHGTQFGVPVPTLSNPDEAEQWVSDRIAEGSDYIKIIIEDGLGWGRALPTLDAETVRALTEAAHAQGVMAVAHVSDMAGAELALDAGVDGLVHLFADQPIDSDWLTRAAESGLWVTPTATVMAGAYGQSGGDGLLDHPVLGPRLNPGQQQTLSASFPGNALRNARWPLVLQNIRALHEAGIPLLAGSDAPNPATAHGVSMQHELALFLEAGLTPVEAVASATRIPAAAFGLDGRGCLKPGCRADMVLIEGNPFEQPERFAHIVGVWKNGFPIELELPAAAELATDETPTGAAEPINLLAQNDRWMASTDQFMGGSSVAEQRWDGDDSRPILNLQGELREGTAFPYAGSMWMADAVQMQARDLSNYRELVLQVSGDQNNYQVMFFSGEDMISNPIIRYFEAEQIGSDQAITISLNDLIGLDLRLLRAIGIFAYENSGDFEFSIVHAELK